ncbi:Chitinase A1 precursor [Anaerohalosphaera lusitana]|uniref:chitinase n=1 Tax=Anaerohalosphaera lusitana TaxID=1936003 RepID=A0A1U9NN77_9BACT|nr:glycosyl hydrolase family 18 protein [Anaerohalosphaera lusitana]AQT69353.1 Chitinase A1 precursor [Anaerohalosphaera lusitana]
MRKILITAILFSLLLQFARPTALTAATQPASDFYGSFQVVGYYPDYWWTPIPDLRYDKLTRVIFFSIYPNIDGTLNTSEIDPNRQAELLSDAHQNNVDVSICIGGWGLSDNFSPVAADPATRTAFVNNLLQYCLDHGFDGIDLDWEPVSTATDRANYTALIAELKAAMLPHDLTLSVAVFAAGSEFYSSAIDDIDYLHIMAYDMSSDPSLPHSTCEGAVQAVKHWQSFGFPNSKIILGVPFYGRDGSWTYYSYKQIVQQYSPPPDVDEVAGIHFNGIYTIKAKTKYVMDNNLAGLMFWELTQDTNDHISLLTAMTDQIHASSPPDLNTDGNIGLQDLAHFASNWLSTGCSTANAWCANADLNQSRTVDFADLSIFSHHWPASD